MIEDENSNQLPQYTLIVNLSSLHDLNFQLTVLNKFASLEPSYPLNIPKHAADFLSGKYNKLINSYKSGQMNTENFIKDLIQQSELTFDPQLLTEDTIKEFFEAKKDSLYSLRDIDLYHESSDYKTDKMKNALIEYRWNSFIDFNKSSHCCFFTCPMLSTQQKFQTLIDYANDNKINSIYFISNTNPLNIHKVLKYLKKTFPESIREDINQIILESETAYNQNIKISQEGKNPALVMTLSYCYHAFKVSHENEQLLNNNPATTPALLKILSEHLPVNKTVIISQYSNDLTEAANLGFSPENIIPSKDFYEGNNRPTLNLQTSSLDLV